MSFLPFALIAYFLIALNVALDKIILKKAMPSPVTYCFYVGLMSIFGLVFAPFGRVWYGPIEALYGLIVGAIFMLAIYLMYKALFTCEASRVGPIIGAITPVFVALFSILFLGEHLRGKSFLAFILLVAGGVLITLDLRERKNWISIDPKNKKLILTVLASALVFGIYYVLLKGIFNDQNFVAGLVWTRVGAFLASFLFLISAKNRKLIFSNSQKTKLSSGGLIVANKAMSGVAFALLNYAIALGNVAIVNAMQGIQYVFLLILVVLFSKFYPKILNEEMGGGILAQKFIAIMLIGAGLLMIGASH